MLAIQKNDLVILSSTESGKVVGIINANELIVYKIEKAIDNQIIYVDKKLVRLDKQCTVNYIRTFACEILNFISYTLIRR